MSKFSLKGKTAIVTGGGSGIGKAIAKTFAAQGAAVHILDFNKKGADETAKEITAVNQKAVAYECDVSIQKNVNEVILEISKIDSIDILNYSIN